MFSVWEQDCKVILFIDFVRCVSDDVGIQSELNVGAILDSVRSIIFDWRCTFASMGHLNSVLHP